MKIQFKQRDSFLKLLTVLLAIPFLAFYPITGTAKKPTCPGHPSCGDPDPEPDPASTVPAFAYYCKSNPNAGAICLANADGSTPVEIFTTSKFQGDDFRVSAYQDSTSGRVLVIDKFDLYRIDYSLEEGVFKDVTSQVKIVDSDISGNVHAIDWNPDGSDYAYSQDGNIYLDSRNQNGMGPVLSLSQDIGQGIFDLSWGVDAAHLYFIRLVLDETTGESLTAWQLRRANIGGGLNTPLTIYETDCLFTSNERVDEDCPATHSELWHLKDVSVIENEGGEEILVSAVVKETGGFATFLVIDDNDQSTISIPNLRGRDWTPDSTIIGETDDGELVEAIPPDGEYKVIFRKNATSADWVN
jgi:hypothetical protein